MSPNLALLATIAIIVIVIKIDFRNINYKPTKLLIVPLLWFMFIVSRNPALWFYTGQGGTISPEAVLDGNPINRNTYSLLLLSGFIIILFRKINWSMVLRNNIWVLIIFIYFFISITWSDFPGTTLKRIFRDIGNPLMVLIILTDRNPVDAVKHILKLTTYIFIPLSITLYKYFPGLGRVYHRWSGEMSITGVALTKNGLGCLCLICGFYLIWNLFDIKSKNGQRDPKVYIAVQIAYLLMVLWILFTIDSVTSIITLTVAVVMFCILGLNAVKNNIRIMGFYSLCVMVAATIIICNTNFLITAFNIFERDITLTGRTILWDELFSMRTNPIVGVGYESFWLGERLSYFFDRFWWRPNQSHNGYIEIYLEQGLIGLTLMTLFLISTYRKICQEFSNNFNYGKFRMAMFVVILLYNITESAFKSLSSIWFMMLLISMVDSNSNSGNGLRGQESRQ